MTRRFALPSLLPLAFAALAAVANAAPPVVSAEALQLARAAVAAGDNKESAFAVIDKKQARVSVYDARGRLMGSSPVLLGLAHGDDSVPGIGERKMADIRPDERTTGDDLVEMGTWTYGLPYAEALPDGDVLVVHYAGDAGAVDIRLARLRP